MFFRLSPKDVRYIPSCAFHVKDISSIKMVNKSIYLMDYLIALFFGFKRTLKVCCTKRSQAERLSGRFYLFAFLHTGNLKGGLCYLSCLRIYDLQCPFTALTVMFTEVFQRFCHPGLTRTL